jgi:diadenosine tetraphosphate (Ap4A) HIT family hydrolase
MSSTITIEANQSGHLWADDPDAWRRLCTPEGCPMCGDDPHPEWTLGETEVCRVSAWPEAVLPGYACVLSKAHIVEPFELSEADQAAFFVDAMAVARGLAKLFSPSKMNYEIHGNTVPHLHMHLFPRSAGDVYVGFPNHCRASFTRSSSELEAMRHAVRSSLHARLVR